MTLDVERIVNRRVGLEEALHAYVLARLEQSDLANLVAQMTPAERMAAINQPALLARIAAAVKSHDDAAQLPASMASVGAPVSVS